MEKECRHNRLLGSCLRCSWGAGQGSNVITSAADQRLVGVPSVDGKHCYLHWKAAEVLFDLNTARTTEGLEPFLIASGYRYRRWATRGQYELELVRRYADRLPKGATRTEIVKYGRKYLAFESLHFTGLAMDFGNNGLAPVSKTIPKQMKTKAYKWLLEYAERSHIKGKFVNYSVEPWHWSVFISKEDWLSVE